MKAPRRRLLVVGAPRSGTTWITKVFAHAQGVLLVNEPDNEWPKPFALKAKLGLGRFPVLGPDDPAPNDFRELWERAFAGYRQSRPYWLLARALRNGRTDIDLWRALCDHANPYVSPRLRLLTALARPPSKGPRAETVVVKSVYGALAVEWIAEQVRPEVLIVLRHPLNVLASWVENTWGGCALDTNPRVRERFGSRFGLPELSAEASHLARVAWEVGLVTSVLEDCAQRHTDWFTVRHEDLCVDPPDRFRQLFERLELTWNEEPRGYLEGTNRPGTGFTVFRIWSEQPDRWRTRLDPSQLREAWSVLSRFRAPWVPLVGAEIA
jgi:hypothetical protein